MNSGSGDLEELGAKELIGALLSFDFSLTNSLDRKDITGICNRSNEIWCADITIVKTLDVQKHNLWVG